MREIKFRAWDKDNYKMLYNAQISGYLDYFFVGYTDGSGCSKEKDCIIMQYTGLKDINGKEIYEGDICTCREMCKAKSYFGAKEESFYGEVVFRDGAYEVTSTNDFSPLDKHYIYTRKIEVIGNIYENPELLS